ncbi:DUF2207 domain-containing protein, partial [Rhodococcus electrodiphilus]|uniref:DUF2207 domain-containing protein n=1 Tax=Rhodococcus ruber TaxID=1830 RepID=UPI0026F43347
MARVLGYLVVALLAAAGLLWPLLAGLDTGEASEAADPARITNYSVDYAVDADGGLTATETVTVDFPADRHGIFRYWDVTTGADPHVRHIPEIVSVERDGEPEPYETSWEQGRRLVVAKIGDPDVYLEPGTHTYRLAYTTEGVLDPPGAAAGTFDTAAGTAAPVGSVFHWSVVPGGWEMAVDRADITVRLPTASGVVECAAPGATCVLGGAGTDTVSVGVTGLAPRTAVNVRIGLGLDAPARSTVPWSVAWDPIVGRSAPIVALVAASSLLAFAAAARWAWTAREPEPGLPVLYAPPDGFGPVQTVYVASERPGPAPLAATLLYAAEEGLVELRPAGTGKKSDVWEVRGVASADTWAATDPVTRAVGDALQISYPGAVLRADGSKSAGERLSKATTELASQCRIWARNEGLVAPSTRERLGKAAVVLALVLAVAGFAVPVWPSMWGLPAAAFVFGGWELLRPEAGTRRTAKGRELWSRAGGFRRMLVTPSSEDRYRFSAEQDLYTRYIPHAVAFGVAEKWAEKYRTVTGAEPPVPAWYPYPVGVHGFASGAGGFDSFESALSSSIGAYTASQSSS